MIPARLIVVSDDLSGGIRRSVLYGNGAPGAQIRNEKWLVGSSRPFDAVRILVQSPNALITSNLPYNFLTTSAINSTITTLFYFKTGGGGRQGVSIGNLDGTIKCEYDVPTDSELRQLLIATRGEISGGEGTSRDWTPTIAFAASWALGETTNLTFTAPGDWGAGIQSAPQLNYWAPSSTTVKLGEPGATYSNFYWVELGQGILGPALVPNATSGAPHPERNYRSYIVKVEVNSDELYPSFYPRTNVSVAC